MEDRARQVKPRAAPSPSERQVMGVLHAGDGMHRIEHRLRHRAVDLHQSHRRTALGVAAQRERGDVDAGIAQNRGKATDEAGLVLVGHA